MTKRTKAGSSAWVSSGPLISKSYVLIWKVWWLPLWRRICTHRHPPRICWMHDVYS